jgi:hypothetical protein
MTITLFDPRAGKLVSITVPEVPKIVTSEGKEDIAARCSVDPLACAQGDRLARASALGCAARP